MITLSINLSAFKHKLIKSKNDENEVIICIPVNGNKLFLSEKSNVYVNVVGFEFEDKSDKQYKDTHLLKQSFKKDELAAMSEEEKKSLPIIGNARVQGSSKSSSNREIDNTSNVVDEIDDLPF